uniref:Uncharacterized protein n=1 Tax=Chenopodium quinoa TaxID=63459 RepID=A0A803MJC5_CHEQI
MYGKGGNEVGCSVCGNKSHTAEQCWKVIGYPSWHPRYKKQQKQKGKEGNTGAKWNKRKPFNGQKTAANAQTQEESVSISAQQLEQLLKLVPSSSKTGI